jgi:hypothetical protein
MLDQLQLNKSRLLCTLQLFVAAYALPGYCGGNPIDESHTTDSRHGLYEVREEARKFVAEFNAENHTYWLAGEPNLKSMVTKCAIPLRATWAPKSYGLTGKAVLVYCSKIIDGAHAERDQWTLQVPVFCERPLKKSADECGL